MKKTTIAIIDDHKLIRQMWVKLLELNSEYMIVGESGTITDAIRMCEIKKPEIVLLDINLPDGTGMDAVPLIKKCSPGSKIIAVSMHNEPAYAKKMLHIGAKGYVTKNSSQEEIFKAIEEVMDGGIYVCTEIKDNLTAQAFDPAHEGPDIRNLSMREIQIVKFIKEGHSSKEISALINISTRTVEVHRHNILKKLKIKNSASLINFISTTDLTFS